MNRQQQDFIVFGFASTHTALDAEALLEDMGIEVVPIPVPKALGALCGVALRVVPEQAERALRYLENAAMPPSATLEIRDF